MHRFSLILATIGRTTAVEHFLLSVAAQKFVDFELIVVDQNDDDRLLPILARWKTIDLKHVRSEPGLSRARNVGLRHCDGEIMAFPDDDCTYPPDTLANVDRWFRRNADYGILSLGSRDEFGAPSGNKWHAARCNLTHLNIFRTSQSYTFFIRRTSSSKTLAFDECLGIGAPTCFGSGEDTDFVLQAMHRGMKGLFLARWHVVHPRKDVGNGGITAERSYRYGSGMGRVQRKHALFWLWVAFVAYDFGRVAWMLFLGKRLQARLWFAHGKGLMRAYFARPFESRASS